MNLSDISVDNTGRAVIPLDSGDLPNGIYMLKIRTPEFTLSRTMISLK